MGNFYSAHKFSYVRYIASHLVYIRVKTTKGEDIVNINVYEQFILSLGKKVNNNKCRVGLSLAMTFPFKPVIA